MQGFLPLPPTGLSCLCPRSPLHRVHSLLQQTRGPSTLNGKAENEVSLTGGAPSQLNHTWWTGQRLSGQPSLHPPVPESQLTPSPMHRTQSSLTFNKHTLSPALGRLSAKQWGLHNGNNWGPLNSSNPAGVPPTLGVFLTTLEPSPPLLSPPTMRSLCLPLGTWHEFVNPVTSHFSIILSHLST